MKKILISIFLVSFLAAPVLIYAQTTQEVRPEDLPCDIEHLTEIVRYELDCANGPQNKAVCCLIDKILTIGDWIFIGLLVVAIIVILISAWNFLTASGAPDTIKKARSQLIYGAIGIAVAFLSKVIVRAVLEIIGD